MKPLNFPLNPVARLCATTVLCGSLATFGSQAYAATAAGTEIKNLATVTYEDAAGNTYSAQSNEAIVTVAQVYSATIGTDIDVTGAPGQTVYLPYVLSNTGNGTDTYNISAADGITGGDSIDASLITIYRDTNGNGQPDPGEPELSSVPLTADEKVDIVVAVQIPTTALATPTPDTIGITLTATTQQGTAAVVANGVADADPARGRDGQDGTVESLITVTNDAVLAMTKTSSHDIANNRITYTVTVTNNGNSPANDVVIFDGFPEFTTYGSATVSGLLTSNLDTLDTLQATNLAEAPGIDLNADGDESDGSEATIGIDLNTNGDTTDPTVPGIYAKDAELAPNATVSLTFTVSYDPVAYGGGNTIYNIAYLTADTDGNGTIDTLESSNRTSDEVVQAHSLTLTDTGVGGGPANDGGDDDNMDSGVIAQNGSRTIKVRAKLPQNASGNNGGPGYLATVTATSAVDAAAVPAADSAEIRLLDIVAASADIHSAVGGTVGVDEDPLSAIPYTPITTVTADAGATVNIPVFIDNESGVSDSFQLFAGSSFYGTNVGALPAGWDVQFFLDDGTGVPTGPAISSTETIPGGTTDYALVAVVTMPADATLSEADVLFDANGDGTPTLMDQNGDGDGDYPLFFQIISANSGATDTMLQAIDVNAGRAVAFTPSLSNQVEPGGTVDYPMNLSNTGNSEETLELSATNSQTGFSTTISIDTDGNGTPDTVLGNLVPGPISVQLADGSVVVLQVENFDTDADPELVIPPGIDVPLLATVFAPATAPAGQVDVLTIDAINVDTAADAPDTTVSFQSDVINGQVRLTKTAAIDTDCDGAADSPFEIVQSTEVEPNQCVIWRVVAENQGDVQAKNVTITDTVTAFSQLEPNRLAYCKSNGCTPVSVTDAPADDAGGVTGAALIFYVGDSPTPGTGLGGTLEPGELATVQFSVRVE